MKLTFKLLVSFFVVLIIAYYGSAFVMPSVTIKNNSGNEIKQIQVALPSSNLNFGSLIDSKQNTLHYSLKQNDGSYIYKFINESTDMFSGSCGYVTHNEFHKRVVITINKNNEVVCS